MLALEQHLRGRLRQLTHQAFPNQGGRYAELREVRQISGRGYPTFSDNHTILRNSRSERFAEPRETFQELAGSGSGRRSLATIGARRVRARRDHEFQ
jgi:hypothetical protein